nr:MAG TPA: hypothetical protein [Caudoviricetes sp.]
MSPSDFYGLTIKEAKLTLNGYEEKLKQDYYYNFMACYNAFGVIQGGKKFKIIDPFNTDPANDSGYKESTLEEREDTLSFLFDKFK